MLALHPYILPETITTRSFDHPLFDIDIGRDGQVKYFEKFGNTKQRVDDICIVKEDITISVVDDGRNYYDFIKFIQEVNLTGYVVPHIAYEFRNLQNGEGVFTVHLYVEASIYEEYKVPRPRIEDALYDLHGLCIIVQIAHKYNICQSIHENELWYRNESKREYSSNSEKARVPKRPANFRTRSAVIRTFPYLIFLGFDDEGQPEKTFTILQDGGSLKPIISLLNTSPEYGWQERVDPDTGHLLPYIALTLKSDIWFLVFLFTLMVSGVNSSLSARPNGRQYGSLPVDNAKLLRFIVPYYRYVIAQKNRFILAPEAILDKNVEATILGLRFYEHEVFVKSICYHEMLYLFHVFNNKRLAQELIDLDENGDVQIEQELVTKHPLNIPGRLNEIVKLVSESVRNYLDDFRPTRRTDTALDQVVNYYYNKGLVPGLLHPSDLYGQRWNVEGYNSLRTNDQIIQLTYVAQNLLRRAYNVVRGFPLQERLVLNVTEAHQSQDDPNDHLPPDLYSEPINPMNIPSIPKIDYSTSESMMMPPRLKPFKQNEDLLVEKLGHRLLGYHQQSEGTEMSHGSFYYELFKKLRGWALEKNKPVLYGTIGRTIMCNNMYVNIENGLGKLMDIDQLIGSIDGVIQELQQQQPNVKRHLIK